MIVAKLIAAALALETSAVLLLANGNRGLLVLLAYFALHALASMVIAAGVWRSLPDALREPHRAVLGWLFAANFLVPSLALWIRLAIAAGERFRKLQHDAPVAVIAEPEYSIYRRNEEDTTRNGRLRTKLTTTDVPAEQRISALLAIQDVPAAVTADLLRQMLADPLDDIRLLAYGMLDSKEKAISHRLLAEETTLKSAAGEDEKFGAHKRLAELHWELVFQKLVQGDMRLHACRQSKSHAEQALAIKGDDGGLWFLLGRIGLVLRDAEAGRQALATAEEQGMPRSLMIPYLAEYAFEERRFEQVQAFFAELGTVPGAMQLAASYRYWTGR